MWLRRIPSSRATTPLLFPGLFSSYDLATSPKVVSALRGSIQAPLSRLARSWAWYASAARLVWKVRLSSRPLGSRSRKS